MTGKPRSCYEKLALFEDYGFCGDCGVGIVVVLTDFVEPPNLVRNRISQSVKYVGDSGRIFVSIDCGVRTRTWEVSFQKLKNMVLGAELARKES